VRPLVLLLVGTSALADITPPRQPIAVTPALCEAVLPRPVEKVGWRVSPSLTVPPKLLGSTLSDKQRAECAIDSTETGVKFAERWGADCIVGIDRGEWGGETRIVRAGRIVERYPFGSRWVERVGDEMLLFTVGRASRLRRDARGQWRMQQIAGEDIGQFVGSTMDQRGRLVVVIASNELTVACHLLGMDTRIDSWAFELGSDESLKPYAP
jgi:hypothetical protein